MELGLLLTLIKTLVTLYVLDEFLWKSFTDRRISLRGTEHGFCVPSMNFWNREGRCENSKELSLEVDLQSSIVEHLPWSS